MSSKKEASCSNQQLASFYHIANNLSLGSLTQTIDTGYYTVVDALKKHSVAHIVVHTGIILFLGDVMLLEQVIVIGFRLSSQLAVVIICRDGRIALKQIGFIQDIHHYILRKQILRGTLVIACTDSRQHQCQSEQLNN